MLPKESIRRIFRFGVVGVVVMVSFMGLNWLFGRVLSAQAAFFAAYPPALALHFLLNKLWTFEDRRATSGRHLADYLYTVVVTFLIQWPAFGLALHAFGWPAWLAAGVANLAQMTASFLFMQLRVFRHRAAPLDGEDRAAWHRLAVLLTSLVVVLLLMWTALQSWRFPAIGEKQRDYYNLLAHGFSKGSVAVDLPVSAEMLQAKDPWDPAHRPPSPADITYYGGKYYLYFGVVPAVLLFWPFQLLTGHDLPLVYAVMAFCLGAFLLLARLWRRVLHDYFPAAGLVTRVGGVALLGLCGGLLSLARRGNVWEMPIAAGQCFMAAMMFAAYRALHAERPTRWLLLAGGCFGLALGSRPNLLAAAGGLVILVLAVARPPAGPGRGCEWVRRSMRAGLAAGAPLAVIVAGLLAYNYARFGRVLEFGLNYQLTGAYEAKARHFSFSYAPYNWLLYFWRAPQWGRDFPFVHPVAVRWPQPAGYYGYEFLYGALVISPVIWLGVLLPGLAAAGRLPRGRLAAFVGILGAAAIGLTGLLLCFNTAAARYTADFLPWWVLLGVLGWATAESALQGRHIIRWLATGLFGLAAAYSLVVAYCASVELHGIFKFLNPAGYARVARIFERPVALWDRWQGRPMGAAEFELTFLERPPAAYEPLLTTGVAYEADRVFIQYAGPTTMRIGVVHGGQPPVLSDEMPFEPRRNYRVHIESGALYPPREHPYFAGWSPIDVAAVKDWVAVRLDDRVVLETYFPTTDASPGTVQIGTDTDLGWRFSGSIRAARQLGLPPRPVHAAGGGDVVLTLRLPAGSDRPEPLLVAGRTGNADMLTIRPQGERMFNIGYESWSQGFWESAPVAVPAGGRAEIRLRLGSILELDERSPLEALRRCVAAWVDGRLVWWRRTALPLPAGAAVAIGCNDIGSSVGTSEFKGRVDAWRREPAPPAWRPGPFPGLDLLIGGRGEGIEPLAATGAAGHADTIAIEWLSGDRARLIYDHWGEAARASAAFPWPDDRPHRVRLEAPGFAHLDERETRAIRTGRLHAWVDDHSIWSEDVPFFVARAGDTAVGRNRAGSSVARDRLEAVLIDIKQVPPATAGAKLDVENR
ncbi:MAG TPA: GtrA family protein [Lacunisphaera sp.]|nr:GtrA family protein [Lacunisphaera sp.]